MSVENGPGAWTYPFDDPRDFNEIFDALVHSVQNHRVLLPFGTE
jgi:hypothetical protein